MVSIYHEQILAFLFLLFVVVDMDKDCTISLWYGEFVLDQQQLQATWNNILWLKMMDYSFLLWFSVDEVQNRSTSLKASVYLGRVVTLCSVGSTHVLYTCMYNAGR